MVAGPFVGFVGLVMLAVMIAAVRWDLDSEGPGRPLG
jgi:hypothetical protein